MSITSIADLKPDTSNRRKHNPRNIGMIVDALQEVGAARSIVIDEHGAILAGNGTVEAAAQAGIERVRVVDADGEEIIAVRRSGLTDEQKRRLSLFDNRTAELAEWDVDQLLTDVNAGLSFDGMFSDVELDDLLAAVRPAVAVDDRGAQVERAEELRDKWQTKRGQLWQIGRHRLLCGDSTTAEDVERLGEIPQSLVFDPPWDAGLGVPEGSFGSILAFCDGRRAADVISALGAPAWIFVWDCVTTWYVPSRPLQGMKLCLWYGDVRTYQFEGSHYGHGGGDPVEIVTRWGPHVYQRDPRGRHLGDVYRENISILHKNAEHHHMKPVDWVRCLIANCTAGDVYDPFAGSGTTFVACEQLGSRAAFGVELDPAMVAVTLERLSDLGLSPELAG